MEANIIGYSERGAMNALFYYIGMAEKEEGKKLLTRLFALGDIHITFNSFKLYIEGSLSGFGSPDLVAILDTLEGSHIAVFIEAKVGQWKEKEAYKRFMGNESYETKSFYKNYASNLFYQLYLKKLLFDNKEKNNIEDKYKYTKRSIRKLGKNNVVKKLFKEIQKCSKAYYITITPHKLQSKYPKENDNLPAINSISWKEIKEEFSDINLIKETFKWNEEQIYNNQYPL